MSEEGWRETQRRLEEDAAMQVWSEETPRRPQEWPCRWAWLPYRPTATLSSFSQLKSAEPVRWGRSSTCSGAAETVCS